MLKQLSFFVTLCHSKPSGVERMDTAEGISSISSNFEYSVNSDVVPQKSLVTIPNGLLEELKNRNWSNLVLVIESLSDSSAKVSQFVHEYDFGHQQFNGYRSFLKIIQSYLYEVQAFILIPALNNGTNQGLPEQVAKDMHLLAGSINRHKLVNAKNRRKVLSDLISIGKFFRKQFQLLEMVRIKEIAKTSIKPEELIDLGDGVTVHSSEREIMKWLLDITEEEVIPFFNPTIKNFWLHGASRKLMDLFLTAGLTRITPLYKSFQVLFDGSIRATIGAHIALNCEVEQQKAIWSVTDNNLYRLVQKIKKINRPIQITTRSIPKQFNFGILQDGSLHTSAGDYPGLPGSSNSIECMIIRPQITMSDDSLIFHCHGGGFIAMSPKGHEPYLGYWCDTLNIPIVCPNYGKAPEKPYPHGIQDILDTYLFFTSGKDEVEIILGFHPKNIVITGDSAGGNLALVLTLILHECSKIQNNNNNILMPNAIYLLYPTANSACEISASRAMCTFDPILNIAAVFSVAHAYNCKYEKSSVLWIRKDEQSIEQAMKTVIKKQQDPFVNPLCYEKFHQLKHVKCFIQCCEFDTLLDDSIAIAKSWQGPVVIDLVNDHCHGFMVMAGQKAVSRHLDTFFKRIKSAFSKIPLTNSNSGSSDTAHSKL